MIVRTEVERREAADELGAILADWRACTMPAEEQAKFDAIAEAIDAYDAEVAARPEPAPPAPTVDESECPPLAAKYRGLRDVRTDADRALAFGDMQELLADYRARSMPDNVQFAFDHLAQAISIYDAERVAAENTIPSIHESNLALLAAFRAKR